jgi:hypothetical protein
MATEALIKMMLFSQTDDIEEKDIYPPGIR